MEFSKEGVAVLMPLVLALTSCGETSPEDLVVGSWAEEPGDNCFIQFLPGGEMRMDARKGLETKQWSVADGYLIIDGRKHAVEAVGKDEIKLRDIALADAGQGDSLFRCEGKVG